MKPIKSLDMVHPLLVKAHFKILKHIIDAHDMPFRLFETGRTHDRHQILLSKGRTKDIVSGHLFNLENDPPLFTTAIDYVYYNGKWSWNFRDSTVHSWYLLFGNMVLDLCPELSWNGLNRKGANFTHFMLRNEIIIENLHQYPCVTR